MLKLVIADDEKLIRESISHLIDWSALNIEYSRSAKMGWKRSRSYRKASPILS